MILNLVHPEKSDIAYEIFYFPDGEPQIEILTDLCNLKEGISLKCRICNPEDLFILMQTMDILNRHEALVDMTIYYLMGARMDRLMGYGRPITKKVVNQVLKSFDCNSIKVIEPHSLIYFHNYDWDGVSTSEDFAKNHPEYQLVTPVHGAVERYEDLRFVGFGNKIRDVETGKITKFDFIFDEIDEEQPILIIDDLCDGGGTFVGLAEEMRKHTKTDIDIFVTHMVNPKGIENLSKTFRHVYFTNSYKDWDNLPENCTMLEIV